MRRDEGSEGVVVMESLTVVNADTDQRGAQKENILIALGRNKQPLGSLFIYPFYDDDIEPEHPHNLYLHLHTEREQDASESVKDLLLEHALRRVTEIKHEAQQAKTRVYACFFKHQQEEIAYFLQRGFTHDEGMYILDRRESTELPHVEAPSELTVESWKMQTEAEQRQFIETHRRVFPRHPDSAKALQELMLLPGWNNFTAWSGSEIAGNLVVLSRRQDNETTGCIEDLFVQKQWRRKGIAKYLLFTALKHFQNIGIRQVQLEVWSANKPALHLYRLFGFFPIDETEIAVGRYV
jgi:ribosomal protein S18 acetylase RimI-like enzyme